jgi:hypothetical protein
MESMLVNGVTLQSEITAQKAESFAPNFAPGFAPSAEQIIEILGERGSRVH